MKRLIAQSEILHKSTIYKVGQSLPTDDQETVDAWLSVGSAVWKDDEVVEEKPAKAKLVTAEPGLAGEAVNSETPENLVGKVPKSPARSRGRKKDVV